MQSVAFVYIDKVIKNQYCVFRILKGPAKQEDAEMRITNTQAATNASIGITIWLRRTQLKISQRDLGEAVGGMSEKQIEGYESGTEPLRADQLPLFAQALRLHISNLFVLFNQNTSTSDPFFPVETIRLWRTMDHVDARVQVRVALGLAGTKIWI